MRKLTQQEAAERIERGKEKQLKFARIGNGMIDDKQTVFHMSEGTVERDDSYLEGEIF